MIMQEISFADVFGRQVFDLNDFLNQMSKVDFGSDRFAVARLLKVLGASLAFGLIVAEPKDEGR